MKKSIKRALQETLWSGPYPRRSKQTSKRFEPTKGLERLVPVLLVLIFLGLVGTILVIVLAMLGLTPGI